mgnify:CR=1 FL=1
MKNIFMFIMLLITIAGCGSSNGDTSSPPVNPIEQLELVYISNGSIQCEFDGYTPSETAQTLIDNGIDVLESHCGFIAGISVSAQCGLGNVDINLHSINPQNLSDAEELGFKSVSELSEGYEIIECNH